jgi:hypothetical protein
MDNDTIIIPDGLPSESAALEHVAAGGAWLVRGVGGTHGPSWTLLARPARHTAGTLPRWPSASWYLLGGVDNVGGRAVGALPVVLS